MMGAGVTALSLILSSAAQQCVSNDRRFETHRFRDAPQGDDGVLLRTD
jgi:hypothetical protein